MKKIVLLLVILLPLSVWGQDSVFRAVPRQISLDFGYRMVSGSELVNKASQGYAVMADYAWQLSGFRPGKKAAFISVPLGYAQMFPDTDTSRGVRVISYGWTVRHELRQQKGWVPYIGYALMLNNYAEKGIDGHRFAHQTRFAGGVSRYGNSAFQPYAELTYSMTYYPEWGIKGSQGYKFVELKLGVRYLRGAK
jgi:hypothetical protein